MVCLRNMCMATLNKGDNDVIIIIIIIIIGKDRLSRLVQGYDAVQTKYSMQKDACLIK